MLISEAMELGSKRYPQSLKKHVERNRYNRSVMAVSSLAAIGYGLGYHGSSRSNCLRMVSDTFGQMEQPLPGSPKHVLNHLEGSLDAFCDNCNATWKAGEGVAEGDELCGQPLFELLLERIYDEPTEKTVAWLKEIGL